MREFNCSLLREKFIITDLNTPGAKPIIASSNRMILELRGTRPFPSQETFVIRSQNMHGCVRMATKIITSFQNNGALLDRAAPFDWQSAWEAVQSEYEHIFNPHRWVSVYHRGRIVFAEGAHHAFLDVIEQYDVLTQGNYEKAIKMAEDGFRQSGKIVELALNSNVALVANFEGNQGRCAIIRRGPERTTTFNFSTNYGARTVDVPLSLATSAAFLEGIQLSFLIGMNMEKIKMGVTARNSAEDHQTKEAQKRLARLSEEIAKMENSCDVYYRPEKPVFNNLIDQAKRVSRRMIISSGYDIEDYL